ncbi:hypothetical protein R1sor_022337 [Riccia sorocarpa]|uniref:Uncharacterized protein n=1 Tax=Riccia sorocarpa TaxID=122646 RepID=A0ABD3GLB1_9MARC
MDLVELGLILLLNWDVWNVDDMFMLLSQQAEDSDDSFFPMIQAAQGISCGEDDLECYMDYFSNSWIFLDLTCRSRARRNLLDLNSHDLAINCSLVELSDKFHVGQAGIVKYTRLVTDILARRDKLFSLFVGLSKGARLDGVIEKFYRISSIRPIARCVDGTYIKVRKKPPAQYLPADLVQTPLPFRFITRSL